MQVGSVLKHGRGWRGYWREDGKRHATATYAKKGQAQAALKREFDRLADPDAHRRRLLAALTLRELANRFLATREVAPKTMQKLNACLKPVLERWGDSPASDVTAEEVARWLASSGMKPSSRQTYVATLRQVYAWGIRAGLVERNPARDVDSGRQRRRDGLCPFESWAEIERVAEECGRYAPLVIFAADYGARPGELVALQHRDVEAGKVRLPGSKTRNAAADRPPDPSRHRRLRGVPAVDLDAPGVAQPRPAA